MTWSKMPLLVKLALTAVLGIALLAAAGAVPVDAGSSLIAPGQPVSFDSDHGARSWRNHRRAPRPTPTPVRGDDDEDDEDDDGEDDEDDEDGARATPTPVTPEPTATPRPTPTAQVPTPTPTAAPAPTATATPAPTQVPPTPTPVPPTPTATPVPPTPTPVPPTPTATPVPPTPTPTPQFGDPVNGQLVYNQYCNVCHPGGRGGIGPSILGVSYNNLLSATRNGPGSMPSYSSSQISDQAVRDMWSFLQTLP